MSIVGLGQHVLDSRGVDFGADHKQGSTWFLFRGSECIRQRPVWYRHYEECNLSWLGVGTHGNLPAQLPQVRNTNLFHEECTLYKYSIECACSHAHQPTARVESKGRSLAALKRMKAPNGRGKREFKKKNKKNKRKKPNRNPSDSQRWSRVYIFSGGCTG